MATEGQKPASKEVKADLFEDDDEFEEFEIHRDWEEQTEGEEISQVQWEDEWDDDDVNDDFSVKLRKELESNLDKNEAKST